MINKRTFDRLLSEGKGKQFIWLALISVVIVGLAIGAAKIWYKGLEWRQVVAVFLDPGCYINDKCHADFLLLPLALFSLIVLSGLLVTTFTNVVENISESARAGYRRYSFSNHVLIIGSGRQLVPMLRALEGDNRPLVVMSEKRPDVEAKYTYYCGSRISLEDLRSARPEHASVIYVIGDDDEPDHDARSLRAVDLLRKLTADAHSEIRCYMTLRDRVSSEVYEYVHRSVQGKLLLVDVINEYEYMAERLMVDTDFLPAIEPGDRRRSHVVIFGTGQIAQSVAHTVAHISHYANFTECGVKTCITFVGCGMKRYMDNLMAGRPSLFKYTAWRYVAPDGTVEEYLPEKDFLDVEWEFVDTYAASQLARTLMIKAASDPSEILTVVVAEPDSRRATATALHLPREVYRSHIAVYLEESAEILELSRSTGMYGDITVFGSASAPLSDPLFTLRALRGQRVNYVYEQAYGDKKASIDEAWYRLPEANKYSSIYCAMAMAMRRRCFNMDGDRLPIYEAEHRRWMMSQLMMGFTPGKTRDRAAFIHDDIVPFDDLSPQEQEKDKILIDAMPDILA